MELTRHYISFGYRVTISASRVVEGGVRDGIITTSTYIGIDKQTCMAHAISKAEIAGWSVATTTVDEIDNCIVAIPAMMELKSIEVCNLD